LAGLTTAEITFPHGSVIRLRYRESLEDASRRQGGAYQYLLVDERTLMPPGTVDVMARERLRSVHGIPVLGIRSASNPGGPSHGEVRVHYVDATEHGRKVITDDHGLTRRFTPAKATDNPYLDEAFSGAWTRSPTRLAGRRCGTATEASSPAKCSPSTGGIATPWSRSRSLTAGSGTTALTGASQLTCWFTKAKTARRNRQ